jgi:hypothetical protein
MLADPVVGRKLIPDHWLRKHCQSETPNYNKAFPYLKKKNVVSFSQNNISAHH